MSELVERVLARIRRHAPRRVVVLVRGGHELRWMQSLLVERGPIVGARLLDLEGLLDAGARELAGEPLSPLRTLAEVHRALAGDPLRRFAAIEEQPSYQREVLRSFIELERALAAEPALAEMLEAGNDREHDREHDRDGAMLAAFARFRKALAILDRDSERLIWWRGQALARVLAGHERVGFLRSERCAVKLALGFFPGTTAAWEAHLLAQLGFERWDGALTEQLLAAGAARDRHPLTMRLSCAGPEAEIAAVARILRGDRRWMIRLGSADSPASPSMAAAVLAPAEDIPRWVARLGHRDVPVRAWVEQRAADTAAARTVRALLRIAVAGGGARAAAVARVDLEAVLFGPALRAWKAIAEDLDIDFPGDLHPGDLRGVWEEQRASSFTLATLSARLRAAGERGSEALRERAQRFAWPEAQLADRQRRLGDAHRMLASAIERMGAVVDPSTLRAALDDWDLLGRAAVHGVDGPEMTAARVIFEALADPQQSLSELIATVDHALSFAMAGRWVEHRSLGPGESAGPVPPPVWVLPHACAATLDRLPPRLILTGLDRHPLPPVHHGPVSEGLRRSLGLVADATRFSAELRLLDLLADGRREVIASWRHRDGAGNQRPPGPWIAGRQGAATREWHVGVDAIALAGGQGVFSTLLEGRRKTPEPAAPIEDALQRWSEQPELARRVAAMQAHEAPTVGPHTGVLGVRVPPSVPYSASALQRYAELPYRTFVERVLGLREQLDEAGGTSALLATEQGQVVHRALEAALLRRLEQTPSNQWLELASIQEALLAEVLAGLAEGYRKRAEHGQAEAIWTSERDRWVAELRVWWQHWYARLVADWSGNVPAGSAKPASSRSGGKGRRTPEPEQTTPGLFVAAVEWSLAPTDADLPFLLELGDRSIPFVGVIDRVEVDPPRNRLIICDYKTGAPPWASALAAELRAGTHLQLPLYAIAVEQILRTSPQRLRMSGPGRVGALRLEYLKRPPRFSGDEPADPVARGFAPDAALGVDAAGHEWTVREAAASFALSFVLAIEAGRFPLVARTPLQQRPGAKARMHELMRAVPEVDQRRSGLPPALQPPADRKRAREVVR